MKTTLIVGIFGLLTFPFAQGQTPVSPLNDVPLTEGLKAYWKLDETNSTRFDSTTNQFHLTPHNGVQLNPDGKLNGAALFNAFQGDQGLYVANTDARVPLTFSGDWAVSSWVNHQAMRYDADHIFNKWGEIHFYVDNYTGPHRLHLLMMSGTANHSLLLNHQFAYVMPTNAWRHLLLQRNGNSIELYVDGQFEENVTFTNSVQNGGWDFWVGMEKNGWPWNGSIDEVGYWGRSLSSAEISTLYGNGTPPAFESFGDEGSTEPLLITEQPLSQTISAGSSATFTVGASGPTPLSYQWNYGGTVITGATSSVLTLSGVTTNQAGIYTVLVSSTNDSVLSSNATLIVVSSTNEESLLSGLKAYWKLDETSSTRFDSTTNSFDLSSLNDVQADPNGKLNGAAAFSAIPLNQGLYSAASSHAPLAFSGDWTVSSWAKHTGSMAHDSDHVFSKAGEIYFFVENYNGSHHLHVRIYSGTTPNTSLLDHQFAYVMPANEWGSTWPYHLPCSRECCQRTLNPRKLNPRRLSTNWVFSSLRLSPRASNHFRNRSINPLPRPGALRMTRSSA
jgi:hypothetical protein